MQQPKFMLGEHVYVKAYTDCFGIHHPDSETLKVAEIRYIHADSIAPYYRIKAETLTGGFGYHEAAERFFELKSF